jgi:CDP-6-deoxy-D-xylo-4-hexulose-3-dehydrase
MDTKDKELRQQAIDAALCYYEYKHKSKKPFMPGDRIQYAGRIFDEQEITNLIDASLDFWLTAGRYTEKFETGFAKLLGVKYCSLVNSGSSANLCAFMALTSPKLGNKRLKKGDEVITVAAGFPTTVAPIIQFGAVPVFVDITLPTYNIDCDQFENALSAKTKAVMLAHTLGNPFDLQRVKGFCDKHDLWLIEDNCDALGSKYFIDGKWQYTGTIGHLGTSSFYPPHHITMGEGGAVYTNDVSLKRIVESFRDWGRDCWCSAGKDNTCKKRFSQQFGALPVGYDHKYVYSHFGYNFKVTDMQAAIGCAQLDKLQGFTEARRKNWEILRGGLTHLETFLILPEATKNSEPSWFGFPITVRNRVGLSRNKIVSHLEKKGIQTRTLFAGNIIKHPCFDEMRVGQQGFRVTHEENKDNEDTETELPITDLVMKDTFWLGVYPGMNELMLHYIVEEISSFCRD